jgi:hypothetical protein
MNRLKVALIFGNKPDFNEYAFKYFVLSLNKFQSTYEFYFPHIQGIEIPERLNYPEDWIIEIDKTLSEKKINFNYYIAIVRNELKNSLFAWPDLNGAIITTNHWQKYYAPPSLFEYLISIIYYCLIYSRKRISDFNPSESLLDVMFDVHPETFGCYADKAIDRKDNRIDVALGYFCDKHKEQVISFYGEDYYQEVISILERKWVGDLETKNSIAYNLKHYFSFNIFKDSGFNKTVWDNLKGKFYEIPGSLLYECLKAILIALLAALLLLFGLDINK